MFNSISLKSLKPRTLNLRPGILEIHLAVLLFGFSGLFGKFLHCSPAVIVFGRTFLAALTLLPLIIFSKQNGIGRDKKAFFLFFLQGILLAAHWSMFFYSIQISSVAVGLLTFSTFPLFVTFMEPFFFKESLCASNIVLAFIVFTGLVLVIPTFDFSQAPARGAFWGVLSGLTFAMLALVNRKNVQKTSPLAVTFYQNLFASAVLLPVAVLGEYPFPGILEIIMIAALALFCTALAHLMFIKSLVHIKAYTAGIITCLEPVYGIILAFLLLGETPGIRTLAGGIIIISATALVIRQKKLRGSPKPF